MRNLASRPAVSSQHRGRSSQSAFTLIELLISIVLVVIISGLLFGMVNQVSAAWTRIRAQIDIHQNGRSILTLIASDLRPAALPLDRSNPDNLQLVVDPLQLIGVSSTLTGAATPYLNPHAIFWQAPIATSTASGKMAEVGYFVRWDKTNAANPRAVLCRYFVNPGDPNYLIYSNPTAWLTPTLLDTVAPGIASQNYVGWCADNVIGLWVRCLDANGNPITTTAAVTSRPTDALITNYSYDSRLGYSSTDPNNAAKVISKSSFYNGFSNDSGNEQVLATLPSTIEIAIVVIDAQTANYVTAVPAYPNPYPASTAATGYVKDSPVNFWNDINTFLSTLQTAQPRVWRGAHVYSMRVPMANGG